MQKNGWNTDREKELASMAFGVSFWLPCQFIVIGDSRVTSDELKSKYVFFFLKIFLIEGYREVGFALVAGFIGKAELDNLEHVESSRAR